MATSSGSEQGEAQETPSSSQSQQPPPPPQEPLQQLRGDLAAARGAFADALLAHRHETSMELIFETSPGHERRKQEELDALNGLIQEGGFAAAIEVSEDTIDKMVQRTGFSRDECRASLGQVAGNVEAAIEMLMELGGGAA